jgi:hypothetical protein
VAFVAGVEKRIGDFDALVMSTVPLRIDGTRQPLRRDQ